MGLVWGVGKGRPPISNCSGVVSVTTNSTVNALAVGRLYGTPAIVHRTGGLADTVVDVDAVPEDGTGFVFDEPTPVALLDACARAMSHFHAGGDAWAELQDRGMAIDWSWEAGPAEQYEASYRRAVSLRREQ